MGGAFGGLGPTSTLARFSKVSTSARVHAAHTANGHGRCGIHHRESERKASPSRAARAQSPSTKRAWIQAVRASRTSGEKVSSIVPYSET